MILTHDTQHACPRCAATGLLRSYTYEIVDVTRVFLHCLACCETSGWHPTTEDALAHWNNTLRYTQEHPNE